MQKIALFIFSLLLFAFTATAQAPQAFKYQAVVRNAAGQVLANKSVSLRIRLTRAVDTSMTLYAETHTATTNAFGLVNLDVGRGTAQFGKFDTIDWAEPVKIHLGLDLNGGTAYQAMGSSELLSVPYALYAANAAGGSGLPDDAEKGDLLYHDGTDWQRLAAGAAGTVLTMGADGLPAWKAASQLDSLLKVTMANGDVIYASPMDNNEVEWGGYGTDITALTNITSTTAANMDFAGAANTAAIVVQLGNNGGTAYAAKVCADLVAYGFDDWYLPAAGELNEMYLKLGPNGSGQIKSGYYWSSSEFNNGYAWGQGFGLGGQFGDVKYGDGSCRCVRR